jgi:diguanylate cyclase (GGDEF)-like protein/PAS domain S-box-containing protein
MALTGFVRDAASLLGSFLATAESIVVVECDAEGRIVSHSPNFPGLLGLTAEALRGRSLDDFVAPNEGGESIRALAELTRAADELHQVSFQNANGKRTIFRCRIELAANGIYLVGEASRASDRALQALLQSMNDELTETTRELQRTTIEGERRAAELEMTCERLREQARRDGLTGLYNRHHLFESLAGEIERARRGLQRVSIVMLDLDHFKLINDTHGHLTGDAVLRATATLIDTNIRPYDIPVRYGGEEFIVILPSTGEEQASLVAERLRRSIERLVVDTCELPISASLGIAEWHKGEPSEAFVARADHALYTAKHAGRNRVVVASPDAPPTKLP